MPLSRFTQTLPLLFASEISEGDAAPAEAERADDFLAVLEVVVVVLVELVVLPELDVLPDVPLLAGAVELVLGVVESVAAAPDFLLLRVFLVVVVVVVSVLAL